MAATSGALLTELPRRYYDRAPMKSWRDMRRHDFYVWTARLAIMTALMAFTAWVLFQYDEETADAWRFVELAALLAGGGMVAGVIWWRAERRFRELERLLEADPGLRRRAEVLLGRSEPERLFRLARDRGQLIGGVAFLVLAAALIVLHMTGLLGPLFEALLDRLA